MQRQLITPLLLAVMLAACATQTKQTRFLDCESWDCGEDH